MGGNQSGEVSNNYLKEFSHHFVFLKEQNDPRFGLIKIFKKRESDEEVMLVKKMYTSDEEFIYFQKELDSRLTFQHKNLLHILGYQKESNSNLCGHSRLFDIYSEYHSHNLKKEIQKRTSNSDFFSESELWYLAESCLSVGCFLQERNIYHGDWRPINIMLSDDGYVKVPDNGLLTTMRNNYVKTLSQECRAYLSPELLRALARRDSKPKYNVFKADVFSLGMTLLYASTLTRPNTHCYDWANCSLIIKSISDLLKGAEARYSMAWRELLDAMLGIGRDEESRPDFRALFPLKLAPPQQLPPQQPAPQYYPPPQPVYVPDQPLNKQSELTLIKSDMIKDRRGEYQNANYTSTVGYQDNYYQQPITNSYISQPQVQQFQPQVQQIQPQALYNTQTYQQPAQYIQESAILNQPIIHSQSPVLYSQSALYQQPQIIEQQPQFLPPQVSGLYGNTNYISNAPVVHQQPIIHGSGIQQPVVTSQYGAYQLPPQQIQYGEVQRGYNVSGVQGGSLISQGGAAWEGGVQRTEFVKKAGPPIMINSIPEERGGRIEDNDLDRRVRDALRATQETIDRNTKMQNEAMRNQYGN